MDSSVARVRVSSKRAKAVWTEAGIGMSEGQCSGSRHWQGWSSVPGGAWQSVFSVVCSFVWGVGVPWVSGLSSAGCDSAGLRFGLAISPPLALGGSVARVTPLPLFRENLLALDAPFFNVVVRCVVEVDHRVEKPFLSRGLLVVTHKSRWAFLPLFIL